MSEIDDILAANRRNAAEHRYVEDARPRRHMAVVTCMDARIDVFAALGLLPGDAHVIRNAGGRVTDDVLRSLALSSHALGTDTVIVMQHTKCGLSGVTEAQLQALTGAGIEFLAIDDHTTTVRTDVDLIAATPYLALLTHIIGLVYDIETGEIDVAVTRERDR
jgi:carbonic anhydrase